MGKDVTAPQLGMLQSHIFQESYNRRESKVVQSDYNQSLNTLARILIVDFRSRGVRPRLVEAIYSRNPVFRPLIENFFQVVWRPLEHIVDVLLDDFPVLYEFLFVVLRHAEVVWLCALGHTVAAAARRAHRAAREPALQVREVPAVPALAADAHRPAHRQLAHHAALRPVLAIAAPQQRA
jgi:hypothetical protein